ncbi:MAG: LLM class flavin-dependent oxidoreductase [Chloroflexi bacterium]|nr:LLM class flavin-dependent oxidoreductase [Chloroflexota bacterium]
MHIGLYSWAGCLIDDAGMDGPDPYSRRYPPERYAEGYRALFDWSKLADRLGYESFWLTEHHFQREGYQIIPNVVLVGTTLAQHTERIKFGAFFHQTPIWNPIRLAEDIALADIMTNGRFLFGTGRGSVQREMPIFGATFGRGGDADDRANRDLFEEQMAIIKLAWSSDEFSYQSDRFTIPAPGFLNTGNPATGRPWDKVTLVPRPIHRIPIYQAVTSEPTFHYVAKEGHIAIFPFANRTLFTPRWNLFGELVEKYQGRPVRGDDRMLVVQVHIGDTREQAMARFRPAHDERNRFLGAQRPIGGYLDEAGKPFGFGRLPTLEESMDQAGWFVGTAEDVRDGLAEVVSRYGVGQLAVEIAFAGMSTSLIEEQISAFATEVRPAIERMAAESVDGAAPAGAR